MAISPSTWRWIAISALWTLVGGIGFVVLVQAMLVVFAPFGDWQLPGVAKVAIVNVERDEQGRISGKVLARQGAKDRILTLSKEEALELEDLAEAWILDNYYAAGARPDQFLLTPQRLLMEYPEPLILLALWGIHRLRRAQVKAAKEVPDRPRTVWRDEFHVRAERFSSPKGPEEI